MFFWYFFCERNLKIKLILANLKRIVIVYVAKFQMRASKYLTLEQIERRVSVLFNIHKMLVINWQNFDSLVFDRTPETELVLDD